MQTHQLLKHTNACIVLVATDIQCELLWPIVNLSLYYTYFFPQKWNEWLWHIKKPPKRLAKWQWQRFLKKIYKKFNYGLPWSTMVLFFHGLKVQHTQKGKKNKALNFFSTINTDLTDLGFANCKVLLQLCFLCLACQPTLNRWDLQSGVVCLVSCLPCSRLQNLTHTATTTISLFEW